MSKRNFNYVDYTEPHAKRRKELLQQNPALKNLMGYDAKQAIPVFLVVPTQILLACLFATYQGTDCLFSSWVFLLFFSYFIGSILNHWLAMAIHETSHFTIFESVTANRVLAIFANIPIPFPLAMSFHKYHPRHHTFLGVDDIDADLPLDFEIQWIGNSTWKKLLWWLFNPLFYFVRGAVNSTKPNHWEKLNIVVILGTTYLLYQYIGKVGLVYLLLSTYFGMGPHPVAAHFIHEHYLFDGHQETYSYYGPLNKVSYNVGYHNEHHDFMNVPGSQLPALKALLEEEYETLTSHRSWTNVLWQFITRKDMGLPSRLVRTREDFFEGKNELVRERTYRELYR